MCCSHNSVTNCKSKVLYRWQAIDFTANKHTLSTTIQMYSSSVLNTEIKTVFNEIIDGFCYRGRRRIENNRQNVDQGRRNGGGAGIRTLGGDKPSLVFKTSAFDHSAISPKCAYHNKKLWTALVLLHIFLQFIRSFLFRQKRWEKQ